MRKKIVLSVVVSILLSAIWAQARPQETDYMACSIVDNGNYVAITAMPQAYLTSMGQESAIARRSCDSKMVKDGYGWGTVYDCTETLKSMKLLLRQLQASRACPMTEDVE